MYLESGLKYFRRNIMPTNSNTEVNIKTESQGTTAATGAAKIRHREGEHELDDQGTDQYQAGQLLKRVRDEVFDGSNEALALALGRPVEEIEAWTSGERSIDADLVLKARTLVTERGFDIE
jgi:hypothetical protein